MSIVSSIIASQSVQTDGRVWVTEAHTDQLGVIYNITYLAQDSSGISAHLANSATNLAAQLTANEIASNIAALTTQGKYATPTLNYSTAQANAAALCAAWASMTATQAIFVGEYLNTIPASGLTAPFGWTLAQVEAAQTTYFIPYAAMAASIRAAAGI